MELKITKKSFGAAHVGKVEQTDVYFSKEGSFGAVQVEKVEFLGAAQARKIGDFRAAHTHTVLICNKGVLIPFHNGEEALDCQ